MDQVIIRELRVTCIVGVLPEERTTPQEVVVSLAVGTDIVPAARTGELDCTIDYAALAERVATLIVTGRYRLLETMAEDLAASVLADPRAAAVRVTVRKPAAIADARAAGVEIFRERAADTGLMRPARRPAIVGVINLSPESNVPGAHAAGLAAVRDRAAALSADGAGYVELGARSISHDRAPIDDAEEWRRLQPALNALVAAGYRVAVDTWSEASATAALDAGACLINFTGAWPSEELCGAVAAAGATLCALYLPYADPYRMRACKPASYRVADILKRFRTLRARARAAGLDRLVLDPNLGIFHPSHDDATKIAHQVQAMAALPAVARLGCPTLAYLARKSALTSRQLIAAQLAALGVDYIRAHEPAIAVRAWQLHAALAPAPVPAAVPAANRG